MFSFATASAACPSGSSAGCGATMGIAGAAIGNGAGSTGGGGIAGAASTGGGPGDIVNRTLAGC